MHRVDANASGGRLDRSLVRVEVVNTGLERVVATAGERIRDNDDHAIATVAKRRVEIAGYAADGIGQDLTQGFIHR